MLEYIFEITKHHIQKAPKSKAHGSTKSLWHISDFKSQKRCYNLISSCNLLGADIVNSQYETTNYCAPIRAKVSTWNPFVLRSTGLPSTFEKRYLFFSKWSIPPKGLNLSNLVLQGTVLPSTFEKRCLWFSNWSFYSEVLSNSKSGSEPRSTSEHLLSTEPSANYVYK